MTVVIGGMPRGGYAHDMAGADEIQLVAAALQRPRRGYLRRLDGVRQMMTTGEASRQLEIFADRIADLTLEELRELYDETFRDEVSAVQRLIERLVQTRTDGAEADAAVSALEPLLQRLDDERNPLAYAVRSLCCLLLQRVKASYFEPSSS